MKIKKALENLLLIQVILCWTLVLLGRKTYSYISIMNIYAIELSLILTLGVFIIFVIFNAGIKKINNNIRNIIIISSIFLLYCLIRYVANGRGIAQAAITGIYTIYFITYLIIFSQFSIVNLNYCIKYLIY
jgi:hypothetical protein